MIVVEKAIKKGDNNRTLLRKTANITATAVFAGALAITPGMAVYGATQPGQTAMSSQSSIQSTLNQAANYTERQGLKVVFEVGGILVGTYALKHVFTHKVSKEVNEYEIMNQRRSKNSYRWGH